MTRKRSLFLFIAWLGMVSVWGEEAQKAPLTLEQCISIAIQQNPLVLSSLHQLQASQARIHQAKALAQPRLNFDSDLQPSFFNFKESDESYLGLIQTLEFPGKRSLRGQIASREAQEVFQEIDLLKLDITFQVKQAFYSLLLAQEMFRFAEQDRELARDYLQKAEVKFNAGDVARMEVLRARVEASKTENAVRTASNKIRLARAQLNFLLSREKYDQLEIEGELKARPLVPGLEELTQKAFPFRPELKKAEVSLEREELKKKQGYLVYFPDFELGVSKHRQQGSSFWDVTLSFPVPLFFWQPRKGEVAEAKANIESLQKEIEHLKNAIILEVEEAYTNAVTAQNQIELFEKEILAQAEEAYNMFLFSYQEGEIGGIELIEARRTLVEARKSYADSLSNYALALAALEKAIGQRLDGGRP